MTRRLHPHAGRLSTGVLAVSAIALQAGLCVAPARATVTASNWDNLQQRQVLAAGLLEGSPGSFDGGAKLTATAANAALAALAGRASDESTEQAPATQGGATDEETGEVSASPATVAAPAHTSQSPVTVATFDAMLVEQLGLSEVAARIQQRTEAAGLRPPSYFGTEVVARFLELRFEHPVGAQRFDLFPNDPITRAEAAWSLAAVLHLSGWNASYAREQLATFELPRMSAAQSQALQIAVARIGFPYVWGGTTDNTADGLEHGGFDCSGFAWRVFKVSGLPWGHEILGRTAAEQAAEIPRSERLRASELEPGDLLFFGSAHFNSKATESNVVHEGIYLGDNWVIHSSGQGVYVLPLKGSWLGSSFAWGRRVIG